MYKCIKKITRYTSHTSTHVRSRLHSRTPAENWKHRSEVNFTAPDAYIIFQKYKNDHRGVRALVTWPIVCWWVFICIGVSLFISFFVLHRLNMQIPIKYRQRLPFLSDPHKAIKRSSIMIAGKKEVGVMFGFSDGYSEFFFI